jgi:carbamoyl-phosphate synthase small subunit
MRDTASAPTVAEVVFTTNMSGYQETFTDPSFRGQIVVMTAPMIGNYGVNTEDPESARPQVAGVIVRELSNAFSNWRAEGDLFSWLRDGKVPVLEEVDTRRLTKHLRTVGVMRGVIAKGTEPTKDVLAVLDACPSMEGLDLATRVSTNEPYTWGDPRPTAGSRSFRRRRQRRTCSSSNRMASSFRTGPVIRRRSITRRAQ